MGQGPQVVHTVHAVAGQLQAQGSGGEGVVVDGGRGWLGQVSKEHRDPWAVLVLCFLCLVGTF